ncbi:MAG: biotin/lipoate A/B protein ligase family protein [Bacteroidota bacterium]
MQVWRWIETGEKSAAENMAIDEALLEAHGRGLTPPTLRFYRWQPAALSLGYTQQIEDWPERCAPWGVDLVRRPTGGRAVLHQRELTYSVTISSRYGLQGSVRETYQRLSEALALGLTRLGLPATVQAGHLAPGRQEACFAVATPADLLCEGQKVIGSAQVRKGDCLLQHGSVPLDPDPQLSEALLGMQTPSLSALLGRVPAWEDVMEALAEGFARSFGIQWEHSELLPEEETLARQKQERFRMPPLPGSPG